MNFVIVFKIYLQFMLIEMLHTSFLDVEEISSLQYGLEISKEPVLFQQTQGEDVMHVSSKFGQKYSCKVPAVKVPNSKENEPPASVDPISITKIIDESFGGDCLEFNKGWWTYKVCHKSNVTQYHVSEKGEVDSDISILGIFEKEDDWTDKNLNDKNTKQLYHIISYANGSICDLTGKPRKTLIQYYCGEGPNNMIIRIEEPATCEYIITVHSVKLCDHPAFHIEEKTKKVNLICSPALSQKAYNKYVEKKKTVLSETIEKQGGPIRMAPQKNQGHMEKKLKSPGFFDGIFPSFNLNDWVEDEQLDISSGSSDEKENSKEKISRHDKEEEEQEEKEKLATDEKYGEKKIETNPNERVAEAFKHLNKESLNMIENTKAKLTAEFEKMRESTLKEIKRSEDLLESLKTLQSFGGSGKDKSEFDNSIKTLEESIKTNKKLVENMDKRMSKIRHLENNIKKTDAKIKREQEFQAASKQLDKTSTMGKLNKMKDLMSKFLDNPKSKHRTRFQRLTKIVESALSGDDDDDSKDDDSNEPQSIFEGFSKQLDKQMKKLEKLNEEDEVKSPKGKKNEAFILNEIGEKSSEEKDLQETQMEESKVFLRRLKVSKKDENELDQGEEFNEKKKKMEDAVRKKLKAAGLDVSDNIKIKIITKKSDLNKNDEDQLLSSDQAEDIKDLFLNILGGRQDKKNEEQRHQSLLDSYNQVWNDEEDENEKKDS